MLSTLSEEEESVIRYILTPRSWGNSPPDDRTTATGDSSAGVDSNIWRARGFTGCLRMWSVMNCLQKTKTRSAEWKASSISSIVVVLILQSGSHCGGASAP